MHIAEGSWLEALARGLDTVDGARRASLSMQQRQLAALACVLLKNPVILIMDEATTRVNPFTEDQIQESLETVMKGRTSIVIAHRLLRCEMPIESSYWKRAASSRKATTKACSP